MTPARMAVIHRAAFGDQGAWTEEAIIGMLTSRQTTAIHQADAGFALIRTIGPESELLTIAVDPEKQNCGHGRSLMTRWLDQPGVEKAFLEVAADNGAALELYKSLGFRQTGLRRGYYARPEAPNADAITMTYAVTKRN